MTSKAIAIHCLPLPTPYPVGDVNTYLIEGPEPILVDTGVFSSRSLAALGEGLAKHGLKLSEIRHILLTHGHFDHAGAALHLSFKLQATLYAAPQSLIFPGEREKTRHEVSAFLVRCGMPRELIEVVFELFKHGLRFADQESRPHALHELRDGELLRFPGLDLRVLATPGHSPDSVCFLEPISGRLLAGDTLLPAITPNPMLYLDAQKGFQRHRSLLAYLDSLEELAGKRVSFAHPGHGATITEVDELIANNRRFTALRQDDFMGKWSGPRTTPYELALAAFGPRDPVNQYLALSETIAHLDLLERDERVTVDWEGEPIAVLRR